jgi:RNA polymerase sigma-70 factor (ECF subfamily)
VSETLVAPATDAPRDADIAFDELYRSSRDDVYAYAAGLLRDRGAAEDVTATAFERAYCKRSRFDPSRGNRRAWLFGIARNAALAKRPHHVQFSEPVPKASSESVSSSGGPLDRGVLRRPNPLALAPQLTAP